MDNNGGHDIKEFAFVSRILIIAVSTERQEIENERIGEG